MFSSLSTYSTTPVLNNPNVLHQPNTMIDMPLKAQNYLLSGILDSMVVDQMDAFQTKIITKYGMETQFRNLGVHPKYPFIHLFKLIRKGPFPDELLQFLWHFCYRYYIAIEIHTGFLYSRLERLDKISYSQNFNKFLTWFDNAETWKQKLKEELKGFKTNYGRLKISEAYSVIVFHRRHTVANGNYITFQSYNIYYIDPKSLFEKPLDFCKNLRKL